MTEREHPEGIPELVNALLEGYAPISVVLTHMLGSPGNPTVAEVQGILGTLLCDVLEPLAASFEASELKSAAEIVTATIPLVQDELFLVPHDAARPNRAARRERGPRGRRNRRRT
jgi:hypothetical protein